MPTRWNRPTVRSIAALASVQLLPLATGCHNKLDMRSRDAASMSSADQRIDPHRALREKLRGGTPAEKEEALSEFRDSSIVALIPDVIDAVADSTRSPRHDDTGWGFVGHQAAWALADVAYRLDGIRIEERGRHDYTFFDDMYKGGEALRASGRLQGVQNRWRLWWAAQSDATRRPDEGPLSQTETFPRSSALLFVGDYEGGELSPQAYRLRLFGGEAEPIPGRALAKHPPMEPSDCNPAEGCPPGPSARAHFGPSCARCVQVLAPQGFTKENPRAESPVVGPW